MTLFDKDQDTVKLATSLNPASKRHGGVWGDNKRQMQDLLSNRMSSPDATPCIISPGRVNPAEELKFKRREAAKWITSLTNEAVPCTNDRDFRAALRSGVLLCRIMNEVAPGTIKVVHGEDDVNSTKQRYENVQNFMSAAIAMGVPTEYMLSMADLESENFEDRPRVSDCILWLKRLHGGSTVPSPLPMPHHTLGVESPRQHATAAMMRALQKTGMHGSPMAPSPTATQNNNSLGGSLPRGMHTEQINAIQGMSNTLREKMSYQVDVRTTTSLRASSNSSSIGLAMDAMGPVLENVLGNLTLEYERRLLSKDQEITNVKDKLNSMQKDMDTLHQSMSTLRSELEASQAQAAKEAALNTAERLAQADATIAALQAELDEKAAMLAALQEELASQNGEVDAVKLRLTAELQEARDQLAQIDQMTESYRHIQDENRKLYNMVQDLRGAIRVFCRIRPAGMTGDPTPSCVDVGSDQELAAYDPKANGTAVPKNFKFDRVFGAASNQEEIYADAQPLIRSVLDGYNVCIFAYGQTGSGKTHTMSGTDVHHMHGRGINYRALDDLFDLRSTRSDEIEYEIQVQMLEIYNESLRDLLVENSTASSNKLDILNTQASGCNVPGATKINVRNTDDVMEMMERGAKNRHSAETKMNQRSSRSHQVLTVIVDGFNRVTGARTHGCLHLIDLAGSERTSKSEVTGDRMVEANHINTSLSALGSVMAALASKSKHIPFRDSKLTQLLADSLSGQAKVMMFVHVSPEASSYQETSSTLKFAERVSAITLGEAKKNVESGEVYRSHEEISRLKSSLDRKDMELNRLTELLKNAEAQNQALAMRLAIVEGQPSHRSLMTDQSDVGMTPTQPMLAGSTSVESKMQACSGFSFQSPAPLSQRGTPVTGPSPFGNLTPMQTIREEGKAAKSVERPTVPPLALSAVTPNSARSSGVHRSVNSLKGTMSMRDSGKWGGVSSSLNAPIPSGCSTDRSNKPSSTNRPPTAPSGQISARASIDTSITALPRSNTIGQRIAPPRPSTAAPSVSARTSGQWGRASARNLTTTPPTPRQAAPEKVDKVPASAGGQRGGNLWRSSSARR